MSHQDKAMDVESLQKSGRRRGSCLDVFLVVSIMFLLVAVTALAGGGVMVVMNLRSELVTPRISSDSKTSELIGDQPDSAYKTQNFAYLEATSSTLQTSTMQLAPVDYAAGKSVGSKFEFDKDTHWLKAKQVGTYFIYINLNLTCNYQCNAGLLSVSLGDKLTCEVELPVHADTTPVSRKCWTVSWLDGQKLLTQMTVPKGDLQNWRLELQSSGIGMFLVD
ncbi:hypothetical protein PBY51_020458 [Eleginops maclovinus]|uniref:TNF family profile domain-containing protein n=1 Tax=Eleginops maclovinus TaxID=56733 RepID=A0AAN7XTP9_ELEMC|nr:hypothetical protein PBY51_020458 [Eleginops maclovinus]